MKQRGLCDTGPPDGAIDPEPTNCLPETGRAGTRERTSRQIPPERRQGTAVSASQPPSP